MRALRDPEDGCPWDIVQTHETIVPYTIEETYEVVDAIERKDMLDLRDELGDMLLQVVYHAQLASERSDFSFSDVVYSITSKMIRRHPHVFGSEVEKSAAGAKGQWDRIKAEEKVARQNERTALGLPVEENDHLSTVPRTQPALPEAVGLQKQAAKVGFDWNDVELVARKVEEELTEVREAFDAGENEQVEGEIGDLLFAVVNLARHANVDPERALRRTNTKFRQRFRHVENTLTSSGTTLDEAELDAMEAAWQSAKEGER